MTDRLELPLRYRRELEALLREHVPDAEVWVYGSRVSGESHPASDLDLVLRGPNLEPLSHGFSDLLEALEESNIPILVQAHDWARLPQSFHREIERDYVVVQVGDRRTGRIDWREATLDQLGRIVTGKTPSSRNSENFGGDVPFVTPKDFDGRRRIESTERNLTEEGANAVRGARLPSGAIMVSCIGSDMGKSAIAGNACVTNQQINSIIVESADSALLVYYNLSLRKQEIRATASGSAQPILNKSAFGKLDILLPPLPEQRAIAHVLGTLDDKIELNRRMNETLEEMARALFQSWFVDFDPVRAKMEGRDTGLPPDIADLFPDRLVPSELGEIPEGWEVKKLGDLSHKPQYGYTASAKKHPVGPKFLRITDINKKAWIEWDSVPHCAIVEEDCEKYRLCEGDVLIARMADPGHGCMIEESQYAVFASYLIRFRPMHERCGRLLQYWLRSEAYWELVRERAAGTTRVSLNATVLSEFPLLVPSDAVMEIFAKRVEILRDRITANVEESRTLAAQRDALLPKVVSGEVRVGR